MNATLLGPVSLASYAVSGFLYGWDLYRRQPRIGRAATGFLLLSLALHYGALVARSRVLHTVPYHDLWGSMSLLAWLLALIYLGLELRFRDRAVGAFLLFVVLVLQTVTVFLARHPSAPPPAEFKGSLFALHVTSNMLAYAAFGLCFILSCLFLLGQGLIRARQWGRLFWRLPPLELLERMSRASVQVGVVALTVGLGTGFLVARRLLGTAWSGDAKEIWSVAVLLLYAVYLVLQSRAGWQGRRASWLAVVAFAIVLFGYTVVNFFLTGYHIFY